VKAGITTGKTNNIISYGKGFCTIANILPEESLPASDKFFERFWNCKIF
jgi:hypothetical protein